MTGQKKLEGMLPDIEAKAVELSAKFKIEVTPFAFIVKDDVVIGFMKDPARIDKMKAVDMYEMSRTQAGDMLLRTSMIHEESDKRILEECPENDAIYLAAIDFAVKTVKMYNEQLKKK